MRHSLRCQLPAIPKMPAQQHRLFFLEKVNYTFSFYESWSIYLLVYIIYICIWLYMCVIYLYISLKCFLKGIHTAWSQNWMGTKKCCNLTSWLRMLKYEYVNPKWCTRMHPSIHKPLKIMLLSNQHASTSCTLWNRTVCDGKSQCLICRSSTTSFCS